jgi:predicted membrane protein
MDSDRWEQQRERWERKMNRWERHWERRRRNLHSPGGHLFGGLIFVAVGAIFLLGNLGMLEVTPILRFWPVILVALGVFRIVEYGEHYGQSSGIFWIVVGGLFLLGSLGILRVTFRDFWPVILIGFGALMLWRSALGPRGRARGAGNPFCGNPFRYNPPPERDPSVRVADSSTSQESQRTSETSSNSYVSASAILGGVERRNNSPDFRGGSATAIMGRCEIDLRAASIANPDGAVLEVFAMWGAIEIRVPQDWTVVSNVDPIMGGYEDGTRPPKEDSKRLVIRGTALMGGIEVSD